MILHDLSNPDLAELIGVHYTHASRIRNGLRMPGVEVMIRIRRVFGWSVDDQVDAWAEDNFGPEFEKKIAAYLDRRTNGNG